MTLRSSKPSEQLGDGNRHNSSGGESFRSTRSTDTVKAAPISKPPTAIPYSRTGARINPKPAPKKLSQRKDSEVSPSTTRPAYARDRASIAPWEVESAGPTSVPMSRAATDLSQRSFQGSDTDSNMPSFAREAPSSIPWTTNLDTIDHNPSSIFNSGIYSISSENLDQISPSWSPLGTVLRFPEYRFNWFMMLLPVMEETA